MFLYISQKIALILTPILLFFNLSRIKGETTTLSASEIISITNVYRTSHGLNTLHPEDQLMRAAEAKANAMIAGNNWSHNIPNATPWQFIEGTGYSYAAAGENLAKDFTSSKDVVEGWYKSPSHRDNLLNPKYTDIGVAVIEGNFQNKTKTALVVQFLATRADNQTPNSTPELTTTPLLVQTVAKIDPLIFILGSAILLLAIAVTFLTVRLRTHIHEENRKPHVSHWRR